MSAVWKYRTKNSRLRRILAARGEENEGDEDEVEEKGDEDVE